MWFEDIDRLPHSGDQVGTLARLYKESAGVDPFSDIRSPPADTVRISFTDPRKGCGTNSRSGPKRDIGLLKTPIKSTADGRRPSVPCFSG